MAMQELRNDTSSKAASSTLDELVSMASDALAKAHGAAVVCWRQFAADAYISRSLANLNVSTSLDAIGFLDRALVITGGAGRFDLIHSLITKIQSDFASSLTPMIEFPLQSSHPSTSLPVPTIAAARRQVPVLASPPSMSLFRTKLCLEPFVLRGYAHNWPALNEHPWRSLDYLRSVSGPGRVVPVEVGADYRTADWSQKLLGWDEFLLSLDNSSSDAPLYLAQHDLFMQFPKLKEDIIIPDYVYTAPDAPSNHPDYVPPGNEEQLILNTWLGPAGTMSPAHTVCSLVASKFPHKSHF